MLMTPDQWFTNPVSGMKLRMTQLPHETGGRQFIAEYSYGPHGGRDAFPPHLHLNTTETFDIISGSGAVMIGKETRKVKAGDSVLLPKNVPHIHPWSDNDGEIVVRQTAVCDPPDVEGMTAALQAAITIIGLANAGKANKKGLPDLLSLAVLAHGTIPQTYLAGQPKLVQKVLTGGVSVIAKAMGKRFAYPEYGVVTEKGIELQGTPV
jgi:mannose-6-phosphate isomerase-like protein (cupin superfamily)